MTLKTLNCVSKFIHYCFVYFSVRGSYNRPKAWLPPSPGRAAGGGAWRGHRPLRHLRFGRKRVILDNVGGHAAAFRRRQALPQPFLLSERRRVARSACLCATPPPPTAPLKPRWGRGCSGKRKASRGSGARAGGGSPLRATALPTARSRPRAHARAPGAAFPHAGRRSGGLTRREPGGSGALPAPLPAAAAPPAESTAPLTPFPTGPSRSPRSRRPPGPAPVAMAARHARRRPLRGAAAISLPRRPEGSCPGAWGRPGCPGAPSATGLARAGGGERRPRPQGAASSRPARPTAEVSDSSVLSTDKKDLKHASWASDSKFSSSSTFTASVTSRVEALH